MFGWWFYCLAWGLEDRNDLTDDILDAIDGGAFYIKWKRKGR